MLYNFAPWYANPSLCPLIISGHRGPSGAPGCCTIARWNLWGSRPQSKTISSCCLKGQQWQPDDTGVIIPQISIQLSPATPRLISDPLEDNCCVLLKWQHCHHGKYVYWQGLKKKLAFCKSSCLNPAFSVDNLPCHVSLTRAGDSTWWYFSSDTQHLAMVGLTVCSASEHGNGMLVPWLRGGKCVGLCFWTWFLLQMTDIDKD